MMEPSSTHPCAAEHMGQCSLVVNIRVFLRSSLGRLSAAQRACFISGWAVLFSSFTRFRALAITSLLLLTKIHPQGWSQSARASSASVRHCLSSVSSVDVNSSALFIIGYRVL